MTNDTTLHQGAADLENDAAIAATIPTTTITAEQTTEPVVAAETADVEVSTEPAPPSFDDLGLHPDIRQALADMGYFAPTPVQTAVYKPVSEGKDLLVQSRTGTGKTTAFGLPTINNLIPTHRAPQALILCPTRELALQVARELTQIGKHRGVLVETLYGGAPIGKQINALRDGVHVVVGTPGRVLDHIGRRTLDCRTINTFILDECDEMLSMGFLEDIERVVSNLPEKKQTLLFSATMPEEVQRYSRRHMRAPEQISLSRDSISVTDIHHAYYIVSGIARSRDLLKIIYAEEPESAIIFCNMRDETTMVAKFLQKQGLDAEPLSSDLSQADRERVMNRMKAKNLRFLCATDVAARGIDISNLSHVINYSVPEQPEIYVHRTGRTGRAGKKGTALSMVGPRELGNFRYVRLTFGIKPEERLLPKDDIFVGKLKVPLPPVGTPQPPDPVQILIRGVQGSPTDLERQILDKLLAKSDGKRVLAQLVADKLDKLSTRTKPKRTEERPTDGEREPERRFDGEQRPERGERGDRPVRRYDRDERPRFRDDRGGPGGGGERRFDGEPRPERGDRPERADRGERPDRGARFDRDRGPERTERPAGTDRPERPEGERGERDRGDRGARFDRDRGDRFRDRDRGGRGDRDRHERGGEPAPVITREDVAAPVIAEAAPDLMAADAPVVIAAPVEARPERGDRDRDRGERGRDRDRDRDRGRDRGDRGRDRGERRDWQAAPAVEAPAREPVADIVEVGTEAAPAVETEVETVTKVDDVARAVLERADRGDRKRGDKKKEVTAETREFWETWAEEKSTREPADEPAEEAAVAVTAAPAAGSGERRSRGGRDRGRGGRGRDEKKPRSDKAAAEPAAAEDKPERTSRAKRDTTITPPPAMVDGAQARLFVSLGKKHGVSAEDLRELLAGPIGGDKARIGSVSLRDTHAHVRVPEDLVDQIIAGVNGTQHNEHDVTVERSRA